VPGFGVLVLLVLAFGAFIFGGSGSGSSSSGSGSSGPVATASDPLDPAVPPLTVADSGTTVATSRHRGLTLRLSHRWHWGEPVVQGGAVQLTPVSYLRDPGYDEWTIDPVKGGTATITATGSPGAKKFRLTVRVG
jgi:hypothetical protein